MRVLVDGPIAGSYSLSVVNREFSVALLALGLDVYLTQREGPNPLEDVHFSAHSALKDRYIPYKDIKNYSFDVHTKNDWPVFPEPRRGTFLVSHCYAWEETVFPSHVMMQLDRFDAIFTTSKFTEEALTSSGFVGMVKTIGNGIDHLLPEVQSQPNFKVKKNENGTFTFLHISSGLLRKGMDVGIKAFVSEFLDEDEVRLKIKTHPSETNIIYSTLSLLSDREREKIDLIDSDLSSYELIECMQSADFCFFPSRGEGFLLPAAEAMLLSTPVCVTACGGNSEFCNSETAVIIPTYIAQSKSHISHGSAAWFDFQELDVKKALRRARSMNARDRELMTTAAHAKIKRFTWESVANNFLVSIRELYERKSIAGAYNSKNSDDLFLMSTYNQKCGVATYSAYISDTFESQGYSLNVIAESIPEGALTASDTDRISRIWTRDQSLSHKVADFFKKLSIKGHLIIQYHPGFFSWKDLGSLVLEAKKYTKSVTVELHSTDGSDADITSFLDRRAGANIIVHNGLDYIKILSSSRSYSNLYLIPHPTPSSCIQTSAMGFSQNKDEIKLFSFGICWPHKRFEKIIETVRFLKNRGYKASATIVTSVVDVDYRSVAYAHDLWVYKELLNLSDDVVLINDFLPMEEVMSIARDSDIAFFPYKDVNEGASGAVRVALASNIPVLISNSKIFEDIIHVCRASDVEDVSEVAKHIVELKSHPHSALDVQATYREYTSWPRYVERILGIINNEITH